MRSDDLVPLLAPSGGPAVGFRQGVIVTWNQETAENTVLVGGTLMENLRILNTSEASILAAGDVVTILTAGPTWGILGRMTIPGTPEAVSALSALRTASAFVAMAETTTTTASWVDLATPGPEVTLTVGASGRVLVTIGAGMSYEAVRGFGVQTAGARMSFAVSGANTVAASAERALFGQIKYNSLQTPNFDTTLSAVLDASKTVLLSGLAPGSTTFTAKYRAVSSGTASFEDRQIAVTAI
jgi:hypothetical protein